MFTVRIYTHAFDSGVYRNTYIAIPLRRHNSGWVHDGDGGGGRSDDRG